MISGDCHVDLACEVCVEADRPQKPPRPTWSVARW